jgi:hypothetical protein
MNEFPHPTRAAEAYRISQSGHVGGKLILVP